MKTTTTTTEPECCPEFIPAPWEEKTIEWNEKLFLKDKVFTIFHIPVNFGNVMRRIMGMTEKGKVSMPDYLCLSDHTSQWNMDIYVAVDKPVPGGKMVKLSGKYFTKVYDGPFKETGKWCKDFSQVMTSRGLKMKKMYMWYTTCPKCAKKYGKNYVVLLGEIV